MKLTLRRGLALTSCLLLVSQALLAQVGASSLSGTITDPTGAPLAGASLTLNAADRDFTRTAKTGPDGSYVIPTLSPGRYRLLMSAKGFESQETQPFELSSGQASSLNGTLQVANQS